VATLPREVYTAEAATMRRFLDTLDERYGGARSWALSKDVPTAVLDRLAAALLDDEQRGQQRRMASSLGSCGPA
jgi:protein-tyrosine phosphatase